MTARSPAHTVLLHEILVEITAMPGAFFFDNPTGMAVTKTGAVIRFGCPGSADIMGCYWSRAAAIEVKTGSGAQRKSQKAFQRAWESAGGLYIIARSVSDARDGLLACR